MLKFPKQSGSSSPLEDSTMMGCKESTDSLEMSSRPMSDESSCPPDGAASTRIRLELRSATEGGGELRGGQVDGRPPSRPSCKFRKTRKRSSICGGDGSNPAAPRVAHHNDPPWPCCFQRRSGLTRPSHQPELGSGSPPKLAPLQRKNPATLDVLLCRGRCADRDGLRRQGPG